MNVAAMMVTMNGLRMLHRVHPSMSIYLVGRRLPNLFFHFLSDLLFIDDDPRAAPPRPEISQTDPSLTQMGGNEHQVTKIPGQN